MFYEYGPSTMLIYPKMVSFRHSYPFLLDDTKRERPRNRSLNDWNLIIILFFFFQSGAKSAWTDFHEILHTYSALSGIDIAMDTTLNYL